MWFATRTCKILVAQKISLHLLMCLSEPCVLLSSAGHSHVGVYPQLRWPVIQLCSEYLSCSSRLTWACFHGNLASFWERKREDQGHPRPMLGTGTWSQLSHLIGQSRSRRNGDGENAKASMVERLNSGCCNPCLLLSMTSYNPSLRVSWTFYLYDRLW